jgi:hypothetical protein
VLRDDGMSYGDYVEQLIPPSRDCCLKIADEQAKSLPPRLPTGHLDSIYVCVTRFLDHVKTP